MTVHAVDWIESYGNRRRQISASELRCILHRPKKHCTWCGQPVSGGRLTWCSDDCVKQFMLRCQPAAARSAVQDRDHGICAVCGVDTLKLLRIVRHVQNDEWLYGVQLLRQLGYGSRLHTWEMDHIIPVVEGGGLCSIDNLRTLCIDCHAGATAELAARRAK